MSNLTTRVAALLCSWAAEVLDADNPDVQAVLTDDLDYLRERLYIPAADVVPAPDHLRIARLATVIERLFEQEYETSAPEEGSILADLLSLVYDDISFYQIAEDWYTGYLTTLE